MKRILVIEDDAEVRLVVARILEARGYRVSQAGNGREAMRLHAARPFDLIVTDVVMPEMDGLELVQKFRKTHPTLPIIAISGGTYRQLYLKSVKLFGARWTLLKPFHPSELTEAVAAALGSPRVAAAASA
jgi:DNA-binding response OmpR family regulator